MYVMYVCMHACMHVCMYVCVIVYSVLYDLYLYKQRLNQFHLMKLIVVVCMLCVCT